LTKRKISIILKKIFFSNPEKESLDSSFVENVEVNYYGNVASPRIKNVEKIYFDKENAKVLDVGCASGRESFYLASKGYDVKGVDYSKPMIEYAKKRVGKRKKISFDNVDVRYLKELGEYDYVISLFSVLSFIPKFSDRRKSVVNMVNSLKPGGKLILDLPYGFGNFRIFMKQIAFYLLFILALKPRSFGDVYSNPTVPGSEMPNFQHYFNVKEVKNILKNIKNISFHFRFFNLYTGLKDKNNLLIVVEKNK
jgi:2-polyprenyl-3-methyl-5-hydroxy-6-metoxy-1,4-benzoquinol methylase|tara:strand:- start:596 stop:1351 length:756 start_codon:yes stop_codon:yes gene_type:complete